MRRTGLFIVTALALVSACGDKGESASDPNSRPVNGSPNGTANASSNNATNAATNAATNSTSGTNAGTNNTNTTNNSPGSNNATNNATNVATNNATNVNPPMCVDLNPAPGPCDPLCQTGCEVGQHCVLDDQGASACEGSGPGGQDDPCQADTECGLSLHCRAVGGGEATCLSYCNPDGFPGCPATHNCVRLAADNRLGACVPVNHTCDSVPADTCADPEECYETATGRTCFAAGDGAIDTACTRSSECEPGLRCVTVLDGNLVCRPICDPTAGADTCVDGQCRPLQSANGQALTWGACF